VTPLVDRGVIATASELFECRHYSGVVAMCADALEDEPECVPLLLIRARSHIALRRDLDAQADLRDIIRLDPGCGLAYRLLGELAARRNENQSAAIFFREALRLDPGDREAADWLSIVDSIRPAAVATKLPAPAAAAGRVPRADSQPRFARGTQPPDDEATFAHVERPTKPFARGSDRHGEAWKTPAMIPVTPAPLPPPPKHFGTPPAPTLHGRPVPPTPAVPARRVAPKPITRSPLTELPGFGEYLVASGILTRERLRAAQAYQRSMRVQLSTAIVTLGLATPQRIEWAAVAHQSQLPRQSP
jgi:tetratricopeptide (TPR) repeat protein